MKRYGSSQITAIEQRPQQQPRPCSIHKPALLRLLVRETECRLSSLLQFRSGHARHENRHCNRWLSCIAVGAAVSIRYHRAGGVDADGLKRGSLGWDDSRGSRAAHAEEAVQGVSNDSQVVFGHAEECSGVGNLSDEESNLSSRVIHKHFIVFLRGGRDGW